MRNKDMLKKMPIKCVTAIMIATMSMTPVAATLAFPVTAYAAHLEDNPEGSTTSIGAGDTMDNNWGTISSNEGTLSNNEGTVTSNSGTVENNWGDVTNSASGSVETNHESGNVTNGNIADNYGNAQNSDVTNNFESGTVKGSDSRVTDNFGQANAIGQVTNNYGTAVDTDVVNNYKSGTVAKYGEAEVYVSDNYANASNLGEGVILSDEEGYGQHEAAAGPNANKLTQEDPQPTAPAAPAASAPAQDPVPISIHKEPAQPPAPAAEPAQDTWSEIPPGASPADIIDMSDIVEKAQIIAKLNTATWDNNQIVWADGTILTVADLATLECTIIALSSTIVTPADLTGVYKTIFAKAIVSNNGSVASARVETLNAVATLVAALAEDMPSNYTPEGASEYKAAYIRSFLEWLAKGKKNDGAQKHAKAYMRQLSNQWTIKDSMNALIENSNNAFDAQPQTAAVTDANSTTAIAPANAAAVTSADSTTAIAPANTSQRGNWVRKTYSISIEMPH